MDGVNRQRTCLVAPTAPKFPKIPDLSDLFLKFVLAAGATIEMAEYAFDELPEPLMFLTTPSPSR